MERVQRNEQWSLFCPNEAPGLSDCWGDEFQNLYQKYEREVSWMLDLDRFFVSICLMTQLYDAGPGYTFFFISICLMTQLCDFRARQRKWLQRRPSGSIF